MKQFLHVTLLLIFFVCCAGKEIPVQIISDSSEQLPVQKQNQQNTVLIQRKVSRVLAAAEIPAELGKYIEENVNNSDSYAFLFQLDRILKDDDRYLRILVDKQHALSEDYEPDDLVDLQYKNYRAGITDPMMLRRRAEAALEEMAAAAKASGVTLVVSSAYRSYQYQIGSFERWTGRLGLKEAERVSARAGHSQHQLGLVVDFGSLNNNFADSSMGKWVAANAARYGFSLSYPRGYEDITGYAWESWHYRYVGADLVGFINSWFDGIQQHALRFIHEWEKD
ncbi:MAG: M15 family metallopeptidase [Treponema sp.]|nr:M15 family metallopeptidase [Treponema sp.]